MNQQIHNYWTIHYTPVTCFDIIISSAIEILNCIAKTSFTYLNKLTGTD
jgi:hypothetical protein